MTPSPRTCSPFSTVLEAVLIFRDADCGAVPVVDANQPVGVLTDRDVALALADHPDLAGMPGRRRHDQGGDHRRPRRHARRRQGRSSAPTASAASSSPTPTGQLLGIIALADVAPYLPDRDVGMVVTDVVQQP